MAVSEPPVGAVPAALGAPGDLQDVIWLAGLAALQRDADSWLGQVVPSLLAAGLDGLNGRWTSRRPSHARGIIAQARVTQAELVCLMQP